MLPSSNFVVKNWIHVFIVCHFTNPVTYVTTYSMYHYSTGHQQLVNQVCFSPDAHLIASASFDKSVKLWDGKTGKWVQWIWWRDHINSIDHCTGILLAWGVMLVQCIRWATYYHTWQIFQWGKLQWFLQLFISTANVFLWII